MHKVTIRLFRFDKRTFIIGLISFICIYGFLAKYYAYKKYISKYRQDYNEIKYIQNFIEKGYCPNPPVDLKGQVSLALDDYSFEDIVKKLEKQGIEHGGYWAPEDCIATDYVAILVPYRNRSEHLNAFLLNMHPIFAKQKIAYKIYLVEPVANVTFNRGLLFNIGFVEASKDNDDQWQCFAFHDVDLLSEDDRTLFTCPSAPTHLAHFISKNNYNVDYPQYFGGATIMRKEHYQLANGYSNIYFGWGAEDDDHHNRNILRDSGNKERYETEGLNTVQYHIVEKIKTPLYTKLMVYYEEDEIMKAVKMNLTAALEEDRRYWKEQARLKWQREHNKNLTIILEQTETESLEEALNKEDIRYIKDQAKNLWDKADKKNITKTDIINYLKHLKI